MKFGIIACVLYALLFAESSGQISLPTSTCDVAKLRSCFADLVDATLSSVRQDIVGSSCNETHFTTLKECTQDNLDKCLYTTGPVLTEVVRPYVRLLETVHNKACSNDFFPSECDLTTALTCVDDFFHVLLEGHLVQICRQSTAALTCLEPSVEMCSNIPRYLIAMVVDEIHLTSDLVCENDACDVDLALQCFVDVTAAIDYPVTIVTQSALVCSEVRSSLACMTNHTALCSSNNLPQSLQEKYAYIYQFASAFCGVAAEDLMLTNIPNDLLSSVYLATIATNKWSSLDEICTLYNMTVVSAANQGKILTTYTQNLLTWQSAMNLTVEKYSSVCFTHQTVDCDWIDRTANENAVCVVEMAERCVDLVLLHQFVLEVNLQRRTWQSVCSAAYNMMACVQYYTGACQLFIHDTSHVNQLTQEVESLVGYECSQLGPGDQDTCQQTDAKCEVLEGIKACGYPAKGMDLACLEKENLHSCFHDYIKGCNSVQSSIAQFYWEWLLGNCPTNMSLIADDNLVGVTQCKLRFGYNINNALQLSSDFNAVACVAFTIYQQCLSSQRVPSLAAYYMAQYSEVVLQFQQTACNASQYNSQPIGNGFEELENCEIKETAAVVSLYVQMFNNLPFTTITELDQLCSSFSEKRDNLSELVSNCTAERQNVVTGALNFLDYMHATYCTVRHNKVQQSCDTTKIQRCLEDFGVYTYFAEPGADHCGNLSVTYNCIYENIRECDSFTQDAVVQEVKAMQGLMGNITCPKMQWCDTENTPGQAVWVNEICKEAEVCQMFDWVSCVEDNGLYTSCQSLQGAKSCIEAQLSRCDPLQYLQAKLEMTNFQQNGYTGCNGFIPEDPQGVTQTHYDLLQCSFVISQSVDVTKTGICTSIGQYLQCLTNIDQSEVLYVWKGILGRNVLLWQKHLYLDCQLLDGELFMVEPSFVVNDNTGNPCVPLDGQFCLRSLTEVAVSFFHLTPLSDRTTVACQRLESLQTCVRDKASSCFDVQMKAMVTSARWLAEAMNNVGVCSSGVVERRHCNEEVALDCISQLGLDVLENTENQPNNADCSKLLATSICVNKHTSSCDYFTRADIQKTFRQATTIIKQMCTAALPTSSEDTCLSPGEATVCDLEEALICMAPVQSLLLQPELTSIQEVCSFIPEMKTCINKQMSGCDEGSLAAMSTKLEKFSQQLGYQCPQMFCEECKARTCLSSLYRSLQLEEVNLCLAISETKQCIYENSKYCDIQVSDLLFQEMSLLVGVDGQICEVTLQSCLQTLMMSANQIINYNFEITLNSWNMTSQQNDLMFVQMCSEANTAYFCVDYHLNTMENGQRRLLLNETLQGIGTLVSDKCQGSTLQCYSCVNATSNEECNFQSSLTCAPDMQMCGTYLTEYTVSKGCVSPTLCQSGCLSDSCSYCCDGELCNQPANYVLVEPETCEPQSAIWCGFQLMSSLVQNDTIDCSVLEESTSCMSMSTRDCTSRDAVKLGALAQELLTSDALSTCISNDTLCSCGQCSAMILLSVVSNGYYDDVEEFCNTISEMYNQTLLEMDFSVCNLATIQSTAYTLYQAASLAPGVCFMNQGSSTCDYNGQTYVHGSNFTDVDDCNQCTCNQGLVACTLMLCPPDKTYRCPAVEPGQFGTCVEACRTDGNCNNGQMCCSNGCGHTCQDPIPTDKTQQCPAVKAGQFGTCAEECYTDESCRNGQMCCSNGCGHTCQDPVSDNTTCNYGNSTYITGDSFIATDGCNQCFCSSGIVGCTKKYCPPNPGNDVCYYDNKMYLPGDSFTAIDGCNRCLCIAGAVGCTKMNCPPDQDKKCPELEPGQFGTCVEECRTDDYCYNGQMCCRNGCGHTCQDPVPTGADRCEYGNNVYSTGDSFTASDGCNQCFCFNGKVECTEMSCRPENGTCNYNNKAYSSRDIFTAADGCNLCLCYNSAVGCTQVYCHTDIGNATCYYDNTIYRTGDSFVAADRCNQCLCYNGGVGCTNMYCPSKQNCDYDNKVYTAGDSFTAADGCNKCMCSNGGVACTEMYCPPDNGVCYYDNKKYNEGDSFTATDGCNRCLCYNGDVGCTQVYCPTPADLGFAECNYNYKTYSSGESFTATDDCNLCLCNNGNVGCTQMYCPKNPDSAVCYHDNKKYRSGDIFTATDGCNQCLCHNGAVACTEMYCPYTGNGTCDLFGIQECIQAAALPYLVAAAQRNTGHICRSASQMLRCIEPKITTCPKDILVLAQRAIWWNLNQIQSVCDVNTIIMTYHQGSGQIPLPSDSCSMMDALECLQKDVGEDVCSSLRSMTDCVVNFTTGCQSLDAVPVFFELQRHLESADCDLVIPGQKTDPLFPVANCTLEFANSMNTKMSTEYLRFGDLEGVCHNLEVYIKCLAGTEMTAIARFYVGNIMGSLSNLVQVCQYYNGQQHKSGTGKCHQCNVFSSSEECDKQTPMTCYDNQVCSTILQLNPYTGASMVTKGCADLYWCEEWYGCNPQYASCIHCCHGNMCNSAGNNASSPNVTMTTQPVFTTRQPPTTRKQTKLCNLDRESMFVVTHIIHLLNFNFLPLQERNFICGSFDDSLSALLDNLNPDCYQEVIEHVQTVSEWLSVWTDSVCGQINREAANNAKCMESVQCVQKVGDFSDKSIMCRAIEDSLICLKSHYSYCNAQGQLSINRTANLLHDMDYIMCDKNNLSEEREPQCVDLVSQNNKTTTCNESRTYECIGSLQKAINNPFLTRSEFCRLVKIGMKCVHDNLYNCSYEVTTRFSPVVMEMIQQTGDLCPDTWCPVSDHCRLDVAGECIGQLTERVAYNDGRVNKDICMNLTRVHHCVINATEECYPADRQMAIRRFNTLSQVLTPLCKQAAETTAVCYDHFNRGINQLLKFDDLFVNHTIETLIQNIVVNYLQNSIQSQGMYGVGLPGVLEGIALPEFLQYLYNSGGQLQGMSYTEILQNISNNGLQGASGYGLNLPSSYSSYGEMTTNPYTRFRRDTDLRNLTGSNNQTRNGTGFWNDRQSNNSSSYSSANNTNRNNNSDTNARKGDSTEGDTRSSNSTIPNVLDTMTLDKVLSMMNLSRYDLVNYMDASTMQHYAEHKMEICNYIHEAYSCLHDNLNLKSLPGKQQFIMETTLKLLGDVAMDMCQIKQCHSCNSLDSNEECNNQPSATCAPLQMCYTSIQNGHYTKGCHSFMTCEEECKRSDGPCYCCDGNMCNNKQPGPSRKMCNIQKAVDCTQALLLQSLQNHTRENKSMLHSTAMCMMESTSGCYGDAYTNFHRAGKRMLKLLAAVNCSESYSSSFCDLPGAVALTSIISSPYKTVASMEMTCRLFDSSLVTFVNKSSVGECCDDVDSIKWSFIFIYNQIQPVCQNTSIHLLCKKLWNQSCKFHNRSNSTTEKLNGKESDGNKRGNAGNRTGDATMPGNAGNRTGDGAAQTKLNVTGGDIVQPFCTAFSNLNKNNDSIVCSAVVAMETCLKSEVVEELSLCTFSFGLLFNKTLKCIQNYTQECTSAQLLPVLITLSSTVSSCTTASNSSGQVNVAFKQQLSDPYSPVATCTSSMSKMSKMLATDDQVHYNLCHMVAEISSCLEKQSHDMHGNSMQVEGIIGKLTSLKAGFCQNVQRHNYSRSCNENEAVNCIAIQCTNVTIATNCPLATCVPENCGSCTETYNFRGEDVTEICSGGTMNDQCDVEVLSHKVSAIMSVVVTSSLQSGYDRSHMCGLLPKITELMVNVSRCHSFYEEPFMSLLSWMQEDVEISCSRNRAIDLCQQPSCDTSMATDLYAELGYYLTTVGFESTVFCQKVKNILMLSECVLGKCNASELYEVKDTLLYMRSQIQAWCPAIADQVYCDARLSFLYTDQKTEDRSSFREMSGNRTTGTIVTFSTLPPPSASDRPSSGSHSTEECNTGQAQWCLFTVTLPSQNDTNFCSLMTSAVDKLSECVLSKLTDCNPYQQAEIEVYYKELFSVQSQICRVDFVQQLFMDRMTGQCQASKCSFVEALECIDHLERNEKDRCRNLEEVAYCVELANKGCNVLQQAAVTEVLKASVAYYELPRECWDGVALDISEEFGYATSIVGCVQAFTQNITEVSTAANRGPSQVCTIFISLLTCFETELASDDVPKVMASPLMSFVYVTLPGMELICDNAEFDKERQEEGRDVETASCDFEKALKLVKSVSISVLFSPAFTPADQQRVCEHMHNGREHMEAAVKGCSGEKTRELYSIYNMVHALGQLSGVCIPLPFTCQPEEAVECITLLANVVEMYGSRSHQADVCRSIQQTKICIQQTTLACDPATQHSIMKTFEPISCEAYSICPMAVEESDNVESAPSCFDYSAITDDGTCNPSRAMSCLQKVFAVFVDPFNHNTEKLRMSYLETVDCVFHHTSGCVDNLTIMVGADHLISLVPFLEMANPAGVVPLCERDQLPGCDLSHLKDCEAMLKTAAETGLKHNMCLTVKHASHCFDINTSSCPRVLKLHAKVRLIQFLHHGMYADLDCDGVNQCSHNYLSFLSDALSLKLQHEGSGNPFDMVSGGMGWFLCTARLEELRCIKSNLHKLPNDVAIVTNQVLDHLETLFTDTCSALFGLQSQDEVCNMNCINCLVSPSGVQNYLPILLSFIVDNMDDGNNLHSSFGFCRMYPAWVISFKENMECHSNNVTMTWYNEHTMAMAVLHDNYCATTCNVTMADACLDDLQTAIDTEDWEQACLSFNETIACLNVSVSMCEANFAFQYITNAEEMFANSNIKCYRIPSLEITPRSVLELAEGGASQKIEITMTTAVGDTCFGKSCELEVYLVIEDSSTASCLSGEIIPQVLTDGCSVYFNSTDKDSTKYFNFTPRIDHKIQQMTQNATVSLHATLWEDGSAVFSEIIATVKTVVKDTETSGVCLVVSEPQIVTFDGLIYNSFLQGEFILYQHKTVTQKVHVGFQRCYTFSTTVCPCAVMVQSGDDVFVLDACRRSWETSHSLEFTVYKNSEYTPHTKVYSSVNRKLFQFVLPTGTIVNVQSVNTMLDVWIKPSAMDWGKTLGLCGTYDGIEDNDFTSSDNTVTDPNNVFEWRGVKLPSGFVNSWRPDDSIFSGTPEIADLQTVNNSKCVCSGDSGTCTKVDLVESCDLVEGQDLTAFLDLLFLNNAGLSRRRKRQTSSLWDTDYQPDLPQWPTESGWVEANATLYCEFAIKNTELGETCGSFMETAPYISSCVTDILLNDTTDNTWASVEAMKVQCKTAVLYNSSILAGFNTTQDLLTYILTLTCLNDCSGNGQCANDVCTCNAGFTELDCSVAIVTVSVLTSMSEDLYTGTTTLGITNPSVVLQVYVYGDIFINSDDLTCHFEQVEISTSGYSRTGITTSSPGTFLTFGTVMCEITGTLPLTGQLVSISNNGANQSNSLLYIIQDFVCYDCDTLQGVCNLQPTSCVIDDACYAAGTYNPVDSCLVCDPITNIWQYKISANCPSTNTTTSTTSTTSSSTSSTPSTTPSSTPSETPSSTHSTAPSSTPSKAPSSTPSTAASSTPSKASSPTPSKAPSSTPTTSSAPSTTSSTPSTTTPVQITSGSDEQNRNKDQEAADQQTMTIVIVVASVMGFIVIVAVLVLAIRSRRQNRRSNAARGNNQRSVPRAGGKDLQGRLNPTFHNIEETQPTQARRDAPVRSAPFNPEGLHGDRPVAGAGAAATGYREEEGLHRVKLDMFERSQQGGKGPQYDYSTVDPTYRIPRPEVEMVYDNAGRGDATRHSKLDRNDDTIYDNAKGQTGRSDPIINKTDDRKLQGDSPERIKKISSGEVYPSKDSSPRPDYDEDDSSSSITHL